jgi:hypothetical protein
MSSTVALQKHFLEFMLQSNPTQRKLLLSSVTGEQLKVLGEIAANVIHSVILLNPEEKKELKKFKSLLLVLSDKKSSRKVKVDYLQRKLRGIVTLLKIVKPFLKRWWK